MATHRATTTASSAATHEHQRLLDARLCKKPWKRWGPYLSERAWGTVREDYSPDGAAWEFLPHDHARSKACRWGEDGIAGISDDQQLLCFALALWNERDPILKERLFGVTGPEGNHGEDVKELYYYLDSTPTHSYMRYLYKYPQAPFPYAHLAQHGRTLNDAELELVNTGVFAESRYFDVFIEYAKADPEQILIRITAINRGPEAAALHLLPQIWYRNTWAWTSARQTPPVIALAGQGPAGCELLLSGSPLGPRFLYAQGSATPLFTGNETNKRRLYGVDNDAPYVKDAFHNYVVHGNADAVSPSNHGSKAALHYLIHLEPGQSSEVCLVLNDAPLDKPFRQFDTTFKKRLAEADEFYEAIHHPSLTHDERAVQRQALAGMLWNKQVYLYNVRQWFDGDDERFPPPPQRRQGRNRDWLHLSVADVMSMPDKWEYPWFAAWDTAFHAISLAMVDIDFAKQQLELLIDEKLMHPNGQIPAYEWEFSDVNPPVQAWAVWRVYNIDKHANNEVGDRAFLERCYHKLLLNFTWWVNRKDSAGRNIFQGGFLGLDNISVFDRSQPLPGGGHIEQADATGWMALFCLNMMAIGLELAQDDRVYEHLGIKFFEHFISIAAAINQELAPGIHMWDEQDGWYYDVVHRMDGSAESIQPIRVRSLVGLVPLFAVQVLEHRWFDKLPKFKERYDWLLANRPEVFSGMVCAWTPDGAHCLLSLVNHERLQAILQRVLDESEFLSPFGLRSLSRYHLDHPFRLSAGGRQWTVRYEPAESTTRLFGGNSNWRGPVWFPTAFMLTTALRVYDRFYTHDAVFECPTGSGQKMTLNQVAMELGRRLCSLLLPDATGHRPCLGPATPDDPQHRDPHFASWLLFHEYFDGDTGQGLGAIHQTGWTGLVAKLLDQQAVHRQHTASQPSPRPSHATAPPSPPATAPPSPPAIAPPSPPAAVPS